MPGKPQLINVLIVIGALTVTARSPTLARAPALREAFCQDELVIMRDVLHPVQLAMFQRYFRGLATEGWLRVEAKSHGRRLLRAALGLSRG